MQGMVQDSQHRREGKKQWGGLEKRPNDGSLVECLCVHVLLSGIHHRKVETRCRTSETGVYFTIVIRRHVW